MSEQQHAVRHMLVEENIKLQKRIEALESALRVIADLRYSNTSAASIAQAALAEEQDKRSANHWSTSDTPAIGQKL